MGGCRIPCGIQYGYGYGYGLYGYGLAGWGGGFFPLSPSLRHRRLLQHDSLVSSFEVQVQHLQFVRITPAGAGLALQPASMSWAGACRCRCTLSMLIERI